MNNFNEYGFPYHACNGYRQDEHYWQYVKYKHAKDSCRIKGCIIHN